MNILIYLLCTLLSLVVTAQDWIESQNTLANQAQVSGQFGYSMSLSNEKVSLDRADLIGRPTYNDPNQSVYGSNSRKELLFAQVSGLDIRKESLAMDINAIQESGMTAGNTAARNGEFLISEGSADTDKDALIALYNSTGGADWTTTWDLSTPMDDWYGVTLTDGRVTELDLGNNGLTGSIPSELGSLSNLTDLLLYDNSLTGSIPPELGNLSNLRSLELAVNSLTGRIPPRAGQPLRAYKFVAF